MSKVVLCFSGGMDSTVLLYKACFQFDEVYCLTFDYGQRHKLELDCIDYQIKAVQNSIRTKVTKKLIDVSYIRDIAPVSSLTNDSINTPDIREMAGDAQPASYVPYRNLMFASIACSYAESVDAEAVWLGCAQADSLAGYWDGSVEFLQSINDLISLNRKSKIVVSAPLINMSKKEIILYGIERNINFYKTYTCYSGKAIADATSPSSSLRLKGFIEAGYRDPIQYIQQDKLNIIYRSNNCKYTMFDPINNQGDSGAPGDDSS